MDRLRILMATDSFPPRAGGSGWSTATLARALADRGHDVAIVHVRTGAETADVRDEWEGLPVRRWSRRVPNLPVVRNVLKNERLWQALTGVLVEEARTWRADILHGQHVMTGAPVVRAAAQLGRPSVLTVRDYWPVCYWSDLIIDASSPHLCPACTPANRRTCAGNRAGSLAPVVPLLLPYMARNLAAKHEVFSSADRVIGVSSVISADMLARVPGLQASRLSTIPNAVQMRDLTPVPIRSGEPFVLYAGKLATNKGTQFLLPALDAAGITWPLVVVGDGPDRAALEREASARRRAVQWLGWRDRAEVLDLMRRCTILAFPSYGPESLSRVLIEAAALGTPIAAMNTGGTRDIVSDRVTGLLADTPESFAGALAELAGDSELREGLGRAAAMHAHATFDADAVAARTEQTYHEALTRGRRAS